MASVTYTHKGWFWFCPILFAENGDDGCYVEARYFWLEWLFSVAEWFEGARIRASCLLIPDYEPSFAFNVEELETPIVRETQPWRAS